MTRYTPESQLVPAPKAARDWIQILARYREPDNARSIFELGVTLVPFVGLWVLACLALQISGWLAVAIALLNGAFLLRLFVIQHDCGHGAYFTSRGASDWLGRALGVLTLTPYDVWRRTHSVHHNHSGNLARRGMGDVHTLTLNEYRAKSRWKRFLYRLYRHPVTMFGLGPTYLFFLQHRLPVGLMDGGAKYWLSAMGTNAAIAAFLVGLYIVGGIWALVLVFLPTSLVAASIGVWLFYVQHQFEETHWRQQEDWQMQDAALAGSSHYDLPHVLRWLSGNIGIHHVHHLYSRIPFYRLTDVLRDHKDLAETGRLTLAQSLRCARFDLWDEDSKRLISFAKAHQAGLVAPLPSSTL